MAASSTPAHNWESERRVITRLEHGAQGANPRLIVASLAGDPGRLLHDRRQCARGEAENRAKEAQVDLFGRRASCHRFLANHSSLLLAALAYTPVISLRCQALVGRVVANACTATIRVQLLKIAAAHRAQHPTRPRDAGIQPPLARRPRRRSAGAGHMMDTCECRPRHADQQRG